MADAPASVQLGQPDAAFREQLRDTVDNTVNHVVVLGDERLLKGFEDGAAVHVL